MTSRSGDPIELGIDGIEVVEEIGRGGFAVVYRARQPSFNRDVAVKVLNRGQLDGAARARFARECQAMGSVSDHSAIVTVYAADFAPGGQPYLVLAYLSGGSLADKLADDGPMNWREVSTTGAQLADALQAAHERGIVHRDVKPENVMLPGPEQAVRGSQLTDFGIARMDQVQRITTASKEFRGTLVHIAPEVLDGTPPSPLSDVYSLGSTLYELLAGTPAFDPRPDEAQVSLLRRILFEPPPDLRPRGVPSPVCTIIERAMAKEPEERFPSAAAMRAALEGVVTEGQDHARPRPRPVRHPDRSQVVVPPAPPRRDKPPVAPPSPEKPPAVPAPPTPIDRAARPVDADEPMRKAPVSRRRLALGLALLGAVALGAGLLLLWPSIDKRPPGKLAAYDLSGVHLTSSAPGDDAVRQVVAATVTEALSHRGATVSPTEAADQRKAFLAGTTDMYVDYDNRAWEALGNSPGGDTGPFFAKLSAADGASGVEWLGPASADVGPGIAVVDGARSAALVSIRDLANSIMASGGKLCADSAQMDSATQLAVALSLDPATSVLQVVSTELARGLTLDVCAGAYVERRTDARFGGLPVRFLVDVDQKLPVFHVGIAVRRTLVAVNPDIARVVGEVVAALDDQQLSGLVKRVTSGEQPVAVATDWLEAKGYL